MNELNSVVLSYHDSLILDSDLELLKEGNWFNDRLIGFVYEYFENEIFKDECNDKNMFAFLNPSTVQYLKLCESIDEARMCFLDPLELKKKRFIFLPLNNNKNLEAGGDHWSLLVIDRNDSLMKHYDSIGSNKNDALYFFEKYNKYFEIDKFDNETKFPKQKNSSDCGAYLLAASELISENLKMKLYKNLKNCDFSQITPDYIRDLRKKYRDLILLLSSV